MNSILPLPTRASVLLSEYLLSKGTSISLSTAQEAVARTRGHKSFQAFQADVKSRKANEPAGPLAHLEGLELWGVSGRCWGDDDDSVDQIWAKDFEEAKAAFIRDTLDLTEEAMQEDLKAEDTPYFINTEQLLGKVVNGQFLLNPQLIPSSD